jgi:hypothetical protein
MLTRIAWHVSFDEGSATKMGDEHWKIIKYEELVETLDAQIEAMEKQIETREAIQLLLVDKI